MLVLLFYEILQFFLLSCAHKPDCNISKNSAVVMEPGTSSRGSFRVLVGSNHRGVLANIVQSGSNQSANFVPATRTPAVSASLFLGALHLE